MALDLLTVQVHLDFGTIIVSSGIIVIPASARWLWHQFEKKLNENQKINVANSEAVRQELLDYQEAAKDRHETLADVVTVFQETTQHTLRRIEDQTTKTNGRVSSLELTTAKLEGVLLGEERAGIRRPPMLD